MRAFAHTLIASLLFGAILCSPVLAEEPSEKPKGPEKPKVAGPEKPKTPEKPKAAGPAKPKPANRLSKETSPYLL